MRRSSFAAVGLLDLEQLLPDQRIDLRLGAEQLAQLADPLREVGVLVLDLLAGETREPGEPQLEDRVRLELGELEPGDQLRARLFGVAGRADQRDHGVEVVERDQVAAQDVGASLGLAQLELRAARDDLALEGEVVRDLLEQRQRLRDAVDERDGVVAEGRLERRVLEELVQRDLRHRVALELDLDPHPGAVAVVGDVGDLRQHLLVHEVGDLLDHAVVAALLDAVRKLGDDDRALAAAHLLDVRTGPHHDAATAGAVGVANARAADDDRAGREVRALDVLHQGLDVRRGVVDQRHDRVDRLAEVVRRHVRRHPDRDPRRAVDEQVREPRRQDERLLLRLVVVRPEVDGVRVELGEHLLGELREAGFGVSHRSCRIVVDRAEVALAVDQRVAQRERLGEPHERVVDRGVAVGVMVAHHVADDVRRLHVRPARTVAVRPHRVEDAAVDGLQAVADVGQRARDDDRHRVVEKARAHLLLELARFDAAAAEAAGLCLRHAASVL